MKIFIFLICVITCFYSFASFNPEEIKNKNLFLEMVQNKRIVFLGECDHWIKDKFDYQIYLIEELLKMGFTQIGIEDGYVDGIYINKYIQEGNLEYLNNVTTLGYIPKGTPDGLSQYVDAIVGDFPNEYFSFYANEYLNFIKKLKNLRRKYQFTFFGFDLDKNPISVSNFLKIEDNFLISELLQDSLIFLRDISDDNSDKEEVLSRREHSMFKIMDQVLNKSEKIILLGHNAHLSLNHKEYRRAVKVNGHIYEKESWKTVGAYLNEKLGRDKILSVWLLENQGFHAFGCRGKFPCEIVPDKETIEYGFYEKRLDHSFIKTTDVKSNRKILWRENGNVLATGRLDLATDLIFFIDTVGI